MLDVTPPPHDLDRLIPFTGPERVHELESLVAGASDALRGRTVWNVNSTATGGGVAEMLAQLVAYGQGAAVPTRWLVAEGNPDFFRLTKRLHNRLHGALGDGGPLGAAEHAGGDPVVDSLQHPRKRGEVGADVLVGGVVEAGRQRHDRCRGLYGEADWDPQPRALGAGDER